MPTTPPIDSKNWQNQYREKQAHLDSLTRAGRLLIPIVMGMVLPLVFLIIYTGRLIENSPTTEILIGRIAQGIALGIAIIVWTVLFINYIFKTATGFLETFHNLPAGKASSILVRLRVFGIPPLPPPLSSWFKFPEVKLKNGKLDPPDHWSTIVGGPVKLDIGAGHALYLERGGYFSRVVGQGSAFLDWNERISAAVNVGPRNEEISVTAWTKEGIKVVVNAKGEYFLGHTRTEDEENILIPCDPESIRKAVEYTFRSGREANEWLKSATGQTIGILNTYISNHFLDDLFLKDNNNFTLLSNENVSELLTTINAKLQGYGVYLSNFQIIDVVLPPKVKEQRLEVWRTSHENIAVVTKGEVKALQIRDREKARAEMQRNLIYTLANGLEHMDLDNDNFSEPLLLSISALLDQSMNDPQVRSALAKEALETLEKTQEIINFNYQTPGENR
jgi:hypothetical protein